MDAFVKRWFPQRQHVVIGLVTSYVGLYGFYKFVAGNPKPAAPVKKVKTKKSASSHSSAADPNEFHGPTLDNADKWFSEEKNIAAWEKWMEKPGNLESWEKSLK